MFFPKDFKIFKLFPITDTGSQVRQCMLPEGVDHNFGPKQLDTRVLDDICHRYD